MVAAFIEAYPHVSIILFGLLMAFFINLVNYFILDKDAVHALKAKQKTLQEQMKQHKENPDKLMELQKELMSHSGEMFKHNMKPMLITFIPIIIFFGFITKSFAATPLAHVSFWLPNWFWYYFFSSLVGSIVFRKLLKLP